MEKEGDGSAAGGGGGGGGGGGVSAVVVAALLLLLVLMIPGARSVCVSSVPQWLAVAEATAAIVGRRSGRSCSCRCSSTQ